MNAIFYIYFKNNHIFLKITTYFQSELQATICPITTPSLGKLQVAICPITTSSPGELQVTICTISTLSVGELQVTIMSNNHAFSRLVQPFWVNITMPNYTHSSS